MIRAEALARVRDRLGRAGVESAEREAEWLLLHALGVGRAAYWSEPRAPLTDREAIALESLVAERERRVPLQFLLGEVPFHGVTLKVEPGVFVPRPETEELVEAILAALSGRADRGGAQAGPTKGSFLDWGVGSGAIAVALLAALPNWTGVGADRSPAALALSAQNALRNGVAGRFRAVDADFSSYEAPELLGDSFDLVVSNPPYVRRGSIPGLMAEVRDHDPREALDGGADGLDAFRHLARGMKRWLRMGGLLALEIGADQADEVLGTFSQLIQDLRVLPDRAGRPRFAIGTMRGRGA